MKFCLIVQGRRMFWGKNVCCQLPLYFIIVFCHSPNWDHHLWSLLPLFFILIYLFWGSPFVPILWNNFCSILPWERFGNMMTRDYANFNQNKWVKDIAQAWNLFQRIGKEWKKKNKLTWSVRKPKLFSPHNFIFLFNDFGMKEKITFLSYLHPFIQIPRTFPPISENIHIIVVSLPFQHLLEKYLFLLVASLGE
jgi:hypothetical protein